MLQLITLNEFRAVETIHQGTLRILAETGVIMTHPEGLEILTGEGARLRGDRLLLPPDLVERVLKRCPPPGDACAGGAGRSRCWGTAACTGTTWAGRAISTITAQGRAARPLSGCAR